MKSPLAPVVSFVLLVPISQAVWAEETTYPPAPRVDQVDAYHGVEVADPYRWLEQDVRTSREVADWVAAENRITFSFLESIPERAAIREMVESLYDYPRFGLPWAEGGRIFFSKNAGLQNQSVLYTAESLDGEPKVLLDPNTWSADGTIALSGVAVDESGERLAYRVSEAGSDWATWRFMDVESGSMLPHELRWIKFGGACWSKDGKSFYYARYPEPAEGAEFQDLNLNQTVYLHRLGTAQSEDVLVYARPDEPEWGFSPDLTEDGKYLVITVRKGTDRRHRIMVMNPAELQAEPTVLVDHFDNEYSFVGNKGARLYFLTDLDAPRKRLVALDVDDPARAPTEIIPQAAETLESVSFAGGRFIASYLKDVLPLVKVFEADGSFVREVTFPGIGAVGGFDGRQDREETFYAFTSFATPPSIYRYDVATGESRLWRRAEVDFDSEEYVVKQVFYRSKDGTKVPMFLAHRKGLALNGRNATLLYGYGGFSISMRPGFSERVAAWLKLGGVYAVANLRGGGEYGKAWHDAGKKRDKQNVFDDFIAAAEWLIDNKYTSTPKLAIQGGSNGGLLVGAAMTQRPDLFGACLPAVGVMDMLRFHRFTAGRFWTDDYGCADDPEEFKALYSYSPYHNLKKGTCYPATLITTADTDDRVVPSHSFKFAAALQYAQGCDNPVLIRIQTRAGHGAGKPTSKQIDETADQLAFLVKVLRMAAAGGE